MTVMSWRTKYFSSRTIQAELRHPSMSILTGHPPPPTLPIAELATTAIYKRWRQVE